MISASRFRTAARVLSAAVFVPAMSLPIGLAKQSRGCERTGPTRDAVRPTAAFRFLSGTLPNSQGEILRLERQAAP